MAIVALLSDRPAATALPAIDSMGVDVKTEPLSVHSVGHLSELAPEAVVVDAADNPGQGHAVLHAIAEAGVGVPTVAIVERSDLDRFSWHEVAEDVVYPGTPEAELRLRLAILRRRHGTHQASVIRLGPLALDMDTYRVTAAGRPLDLTFKEFELLRFLASRPGRVFTRPTLLREVWGYDFYGGTRTVDVHVRRLRAKLGPEHEHLIETVRSVGYRAADPDGDPSEGGAPRRVG